MPLELIWGATCRQFTNHCWLWLEQKTSRLYPSSTSQLLLLTQKVLSKYFLESAIWALSSIHRQLKKWMRGSRPISDCDSQEGTLADHSISKRRVCPRRCV